MTPARGPLTFVVRVSGSDSGALRGTVERVRTGETHGFQGVEELAAIVARLATARAATTKARCAWCRSPSDEEGQER